MPIIEYPRGPGGGVWPPARSSVEAEGRNGSVDLRGDLRGVLGGLAAAIRAGNDGRSLPGVFEEALREVLPARAVRLREVPATYQARLVAPLRNVDGVVLDVATADDSRQAFLEASFDRERAGDGVDPALLEMAANLGALVLEVERQRPAASLRSGGERRDRVAPLIGSTVAMQALRERIERVAQTDFTVLVEGESGTGKELVARHLHDLSRRRRGPFVAVNCAALVETLLEAELFGIEERTATGVRGRRGKFENADRGTLFLDEVSDLSVTAQAKLLRAIQELTVERVGGQSPRRVDVRIIAASNRPLADLVAKDLFRSDLFYRLSGVDVHVPPLRSRPDDIVELSRYFLARHRNVRELALSRDAAEALRLYLWPGNVRELQRCMERTIALVDAPRIEVDDLPPQVRAGYADVLYPALAREETLRAWGSRYARLVFERCGRNKRLACRTLGISYHTLASYLRYGAEEDSSGAAHQAG
ncbi:MAG: sigma-54-dependent Fis family transcriptional regulator [Acidimicrobiia bacterium]|nr:sigma-54-dependent Fis family transcriptional regulator [Acidimicrobiia bacterium]